MWVSYHFKAVLDYGSLYKSIYFWFDDTTLQKIFSINKTNLTWNKQKQKNFNKLCPLSPPPSQKNVRKMLDLPFGYETPSSPEVRENSRSPKA